ncbi:Putative expansin-B2 [Striga hermonthica]|uniref:Expansin-B2 n=1 Tax=Striga hermonthica TaxID=68872 RepID=A0A9N7NR02_STRHE|nr:Putative expansin-B2 [Striga hermonthica]
MVPEVTVGHVDMEILCPKLHFHHWSQALGRHFINLAKNVELATSVACDYAGKNIVFRIDPGSNPNYIAMVIEFEEGDGDLARVELQQASNEPSEWWEMDQSWGAVWQLNPGSKLNPPFSVRLTSQYSGRTLVAKNVIPVGWTPGGTYRSVVNYL